MSDAYGAPNLTRRVRSSHMPTGNARDIRKASMGRKCKTWGCKTKLSVYNLEDRCHVCKDKKEIKWRQG